MNVYEVRHKGDYLNGVSIVVADSEAQALELARTEVERHGLDMESVTLARRLNTDVPRCFVVWDGYY